MLFDSFHQLEENKAGARFALQDSVVKSILSYQYLTHIIRYFFEIRYGYHRAVGFKICVVRSLMFQKSTGANWFVPWHQDRTVALKDQSSYGQPFADIFQNRTVKNGVTHFDADDIIMRNMATVRIHVDDCSEADGAVEIIEGSHKWLHWRSNEDGCIDRAEKETPVLCTARRGEIHVMHPLLVHRSRKSAGTSSRQILHLECAPDNLLDVHGRNGTERLAEWAHAVPFPEET